MLEIPPFAPQRPTEEEAMQAAAPGTFATRIRGRLAELHAEQSELAELEESWAQGLASHLAELLFSLGDGDRLLLGFAFPVVQTPPDCPWGQARFAYASEGSLRPGSEGGWVYERIVLDERGGIRIVRCAPGREDPEAWEGMRGWPTAGDAEAFFPEEVFGCLRGIMSRIVARVDELRREGEARRAGLDTLPELVREFSAACGTGRAGGAET
ncbi:MAG: hypothetical protein M3409_05970 [Gemmatimonadota bacterium]|jgi:hypothetical protein|nr:hypothetical protein [Gemmatimonadota bacterium]